MENIFLKKNSNVCYLDAKAKTADCKYIDAIIENIQVCNQLSNYECIKQRYLVF